MPRRALPNLRRGDRRATPKAFTVCVICPGLVVARVDCGAGVGHDDRVMRRVLVILGVASTLNAAIPAHADPGVDASFVEALTKAGITFNDPGSAVRAGHTTCDLMAQGKPGLQVVQLVQQENSGISTVSAAKFTAIAVSAYCPQYAQQGSAGASPSQTPFEGMAGSGGQQ